MTVDEVELVLITGAGASRDFGAGGEPFPLMDDLSDAIVSRLEGKPGYLEVTGLARGFPGEEFERRLGVFLQAVLATPRIEPVLEGSTSFPGNNGIAAHVLKEWFQQTRFHLGEVVSEIHGVLYEKFNAERVLVSDASIAYKSVLETMGITKTGSRVVIATTNYDHVAELALTHAGWHAETGDPRNIRQSDPPVDVEDLLGSMPRNIPVLHLHGKLGWYQRDKDQPVYFAETSAHQKGFGIPVVVLPDPAKSYDGFALIQSLWDQFSAALRVARRVLVIGHSLNDTTLVRVLKENVSDTNRIGVAYLPEPEAKTVTDEFRHRIEQALPAAVHIPLRFDKEVNCSANEFQQWLHS